jgi:SAM-dependent methyltransferase
MTAPAGPVKPFAGKPVLRARRKLGWTIRARVDRASKPRVIASLGPGASVLDVGCGNESASWIKNCRPDLRLFGIDVEDYAITEADKSLMEQYRVCSREDFARGISSTGREFDLVLSSHNLEHCHEPDQVLASMCSVVRPGGRLYLSFPSEASVRLPSREGCLNFFDDPSHRTVLDFDGLAHRLRSSSFRIDLAVRRNRGTLGIGWVLGALQEPWSVATHRVRSYTWTFWGFESVFVATRLAR